MDIKQAILILHSERASMVASGNEDDDTKALIDCYSTILDELEKRNKKSILLPIVLGMIPFMTFTAAAVYLATHGQHIWAGGFALLVLLTLPRFR